MPLEFRKQRDGSLRNVWFGRFEINGKRFCYNLGIKIAGQRPASGSIKDEGDGAFERSRAAAQAKLDTIVEEARSRSSAAGLVEKIYEIRTGEAIRSVKIEDLAEEWDKIPRHRKPTEKYAGECRSGLMRFAAFVRHVFPKAEDLAQVTRTVARSFMEAEEKRGVTGRTWNGTLHLLRSTCSALMPAGAINPFSDTPTKETDTMFRKPFSPEELKAIVETARDDDFIRPIIVTGICTAMRRGDCCLLKWKDVDLGRQFITVKTAKTGQTVSIPIFPMLRDELLKAKADDSGLRAEDGGQGYVFPGQARMYLENSGGITWRAKKILAVALGGGDHAGEEAALPEVADEEARRRGLEYIGKLGNAEKRERMKQVFELYMDGKTTKELVAVAGVSKGSTSHYLNEVEMAIGCRVVRGRPAGGSLAALLRNDSDLLRAEREGGKRRASVRDFHSFRVTWVTLALTAGVPLELVQKVTGHKTTDIVLKHYFQPGREAFRQALNAAMPKLLTNGVLADGHQSPKDEALEIVGRLKGAKADKARLLELLGKFG
jgi:integrase